MVLIEFLIAVAKNQFEAAFAKRMGSDYCQMVSSGTAALTVALAAARIGAVPILVDIDDTLIMGFNFRISELNAAVGLSNWINWMEF